MVRLRIASQSHCHQVCLCDSGLVSRLLAIVRARRRNAVLFLEPMDDRAVRRRSTVPNGLVQAVALLKWLDVIIFKIHEDGHCGVDMCSREITSKKVQVQRRAKAKIRLRNHEGDTPERRGEGRRKVGKCDIYLVYAVR